MKKPRPSSLSIVLLVMGALTVVAACIPGGIAVLVATDDGDWVDATPGDLLTPGRVPTGEAVFLRGHRDTAHAVELSDGTVLYPTLEEPRVMVACGDDDCRGSLIGAVENLSIDPPLPAGWPAGVDGHIWLIRIGEPGRNTLERARVAALMAFGLLVLGLACCATGIGLILRGRRV